MDGPKQLRVKVSPGVLLRSKVVLGPLLKWQARRMRHTVPQLAEAAGERTGVVGEGRELRVLVLGDSSAAGVGVERQEHGLAGQIAAALAGSKRRRVSWQVIARTGRTARSMQQSLAETSLEPADAVVCCLGGNDVLRQTRPRDFVATYRTLVQEVAARVQARVVVVNGLPPMHILAAVPQPLRWYLGQCAFRLDAALRGWTAQDRGLDYLALQWAAIPAALASDGFHPGGTLYTRWGELVAERIGLRLGLEE